MIDETRYKKHIYKNRVYAYDRVKKKKVIYARVIINIIG